MKFQLETAALSALLATLAVGCSSEPPQISNLQYDEVTLHVGDTDTLTGTFDFSDPDKNVKTIGIEITLPSGEKGELPRSQLSGTDGMSSGTVNWALFLMPKVAGDFGFSLFVIDADGNQSNRLHGAFTVAPAAVRTVAVHEAHFEIVDAELATTSRSGTTR